MNIAILTINQPSLDSASKLVSYFKNQNIDIYTKKELKHNIENIIIYDKLDDILPKAWKTYDAIIADCVLGVSVSTTKY